MNFNGQLNKFVIHMHKSLGIQGTKMLSFASLFQHHWKLYHFTVEHGKENNTFSTLYFFMGADIYPQSQKRE